MASISLRLSNLLMMSKSLRIFKVIFPAATSNLFQVSTGRGGSFPLSLHIHWRAVSICVWIRLSVQTPCHMEYV